MQSVLSRIWTRVAVSISYDDNHYTTGTSVLGNYGDYTLFNFSESHKLVLEWKLAWEPGKM